MPVLTHDEIKKELDLGNIKILPEISDDQISVASVDLHLDNEFRTFNKSSDPIDLKEATDYKDLTKEFTADKLIVQPGETVLGITKEKIAY